MPDTLKVTNAFNYAIIHQSPSATLKRINVLTSSKFISAKS